MKYISEECNQCDEYLDPYGCRNHDCPIWQDKEIEKEEQKVNIVFDGILNIIRGEI